MERVIQRSPALAPAPSLTHKKKKACGLTRCHYVVGRLVEAMVVLVTSPTPRLPYTTGVLLHEAARTGWKTLVLPTKCWYFSRIRDAWQIDPQNISLQLRWRHSICTSIINALIARWILCKRSLSAQPQTHELSMKNANSCQLMYFQRWMVALTIPKWRTSTWYSVSELMRDEIPPFKHVQTETNQYDSSDQYLVFINLSSAPQNHHDCTALTSSCACFHGYCPLDLLFVYLMPSTSPRHSVATC